MKVYGIKNCNTVQKAISWLEANQIAFEFHDFKKSGISKEKLQEWAAQVSLDKLINKKGTTWKKLEPEVQNSVNNSENAFQLMQEKTSVIKRPVIETEGKIILGFDEEELLKLVK